MVMMKKCCCFANTVSGSIASGVFSANYSAIHFVWTGFQWYQISQTNGAEFSRYGAYAADIIDVIALICLAITSVLLIYGVAEDMWMYLIPYVATIPVLLVLQIITWIVRISVTLYSIAYTVIWIIQFLGLQGSTGGFDKVSSSDVYGVYTSYFIDIIALGLLFIASVILLIGVFKNSKCLLIPYMVAITALIVFQAIAWFLQLFNWYKINKSLTTTLIISLIAWILLAFVNVICLLCVISEYQKLSEDRGQKNDAAIAYTPTCPHVITSPPETQVASYPIENM